MKRNLIFLILIALMQPATVSAQKLITFGPKVGANFNFASGSEMLQQGNVGYNFGVFMEVRPLKMLGVSMDVVYSKEGFKANVANGSLNYNLGYLDIPILLNLYVWRGLAIKAGIQPAIKLSGKVGFSGTGTPDGNAIDQFTDNIANGNFSIPVGVGYSFKWGLTVDARYNIGVSKVYQDDSGNGIKNSVITLSAGWKF